MTYGLFPGMQVAGANAVWKVSTAIKYLQTYERCDHAATDTEETRKLQLQCKALLQQVIGRYVTFMGTVWSCMRAGVQGLGFWVRKP